MNTQENALLRGAIRSMDHAAKTLDELGLTGMAHHVQFCADDAAILVDDHANDDTAPAVYIDAPAVVQRVPGNGVGVWKGGLV